MNKAQIAEIRAKVGGAMTLVVARRSGRGFKGYRIPMHTDVVSGLREICLATLSSLEERQPIEYADDLKFDQSSAYIEVPDTKLLAHKKRRGLRPANQAPGHEATVEVDAAVLSLLDAASSLPELATSELPKHSYALYAAVVGDSPDGRVSFVDRWNPYKAGLSGKFLTLFGDRLRRLEGELLVFETTFDLVISAEAISVLDGAAFEAIFRDIDAMADRIPTWTAAASSSLPLDPESVEALNRVAQRSSRVAKQVRGLFERGAFGKRISIADLRREMNERGLDSGQLIVQGKLRLDEDDVHTLLKLVDEKLYKGWRTGTEWDVGTRARRQ